MLYRAKFSSPLSPAILHLFSQAARAPSATVFTLSLLVRTFFPFVGVDSFLSLEKVN